MYSRKIIISVAGVIMFLLAGTAAMFILPKESKQPNHSQPQQIPNPITESPKPEAVTSIPQENVKEAKPAIWYVYVTGAVKNPGVYKLSEDSRVFQAIDSAGGFTQNADRASVNLAEILADSAHVHVAVKNTESKSTSQNVRIPGKASTSQTRSKSALIDVNRADLQELQRINGVGPVIAQRIIDYRNSHGAFRSTEDLQNVKGIGTSRLNQIRPQITLSPASSYTKGRTSTANLTSSTNNNLVDINHASLAELQRINGIGPSIAQRIIDYRNSHGAFKTVEDLLEVRGIGTAKLKQIRSQIVIQ